MLSKGLKLQPYCLTCTPCVFSKKLDTAFGHMAVAACKRDQALQQDSIDDRNHQHLA